MVSAFNRRDCLSALLGASFAATFAQNVAIGASPAPRVDAARLRRTLEELSAFGRPAGGTFADGVSRFAYSDADVAGRAYVIGLMKTAALMVILSAPVTVLLTRDRWRSMPV